MHNHKIKENNTVGFVSLPTVCTTCIWFKGKKLSVRNIYPSLLELGLQHTIILLHCFSQEKSLSIFNIIFQKHPFYNASKQLCNIFFHFSILFLVMLYKYVYSTVMRWLLCYDPKRHKRLIYTLFILLSFLVHFSGQIN